MDTDRKEADMGYVKDFVSLIAQALVDATELPAQMEKIKFDMASLADDLTRTKNKNIELDTLLNDTRRQRDEAEQALSGVKAQLTEAQHTANMLENQSHSNADEIGRLKVEVDTLRKDRDNYGMKQMEAEERAITAEAKLAEFTKLAAGLMPKPEAKPIEPKVEPSPSPIPHAVEPVKAEPKRIYDGEPGYDRSQDMWDADKQKWYSLEDMPF